MPYAFTVVKNFTVGQDVSIVRILNTYTLGLEDAVNEIRKVEEERARREMGQGKKPRKEQRLTQRMFRVV
jgi:hypothetical protein